MYYVRKPLFRLLKGDLKGHHFNSDDEVQQFVDVSCCSKMPQFFLNGMKNWIYHIEKCVNVSGIYEEKYKSFRKSLAQYALAPK